MQQLDYHEVEKSAVDLLSAIAEQENNSFLNEKGNPIDMTEIKRQLVSVRRSLVRCLDDSLDSENIGFEERTRVIVEKTRNHALILVQERIDSMANIHI